MIKKIFDYAAVVLMFALIAGIIPCAGILYEFAAIESNEPSQTCAESATIAYTDETVKEWIERRSATTEPYSEAVTAAETEAQTVAESVAITTAVTEPQTEPSTVAESEWISLGEFTVTAYCICEMCCGEWGKYNLTASGTTPTAGRTVGANTGILPFGTVISINGHTYIVEDTGAAALRNPYLVDVFCDSHAETVAFGKQKAEVFVRK